MRYLILIGFCILQAFLSFGQGDIDSLPKALIRNEHSFAAHLYTNGWGAEYCYGKMNNIHKKTLYSFDFSVVHDPKEVKVSNPYSSENSRYVYGKTNVFFDTRFTYGKLFSLYQKKDKGGIEIRCYYKIGPVLGFLKPIYYKVGADMKVEKFNSAAHVSIADIYGKASFFKGFNEMKVIPGIHAKGAVSFEFGKKDLMISAIEGGVSVDVFVKEIEIMANNYNDFYFAALFISGRFGKIKNPRLRYLNKE